MIDLGIDPGGKPGYAWACDGVLIGHSRKHPDLKPDRVITEGVWFGNKGRKGPKKQHIATLSFRCGWQVARYPAARVYRLPVDVWKAHVVPGGDRLPKAVFVRRLAKLLQLEGLTEDEIEACGLALCGDLCEGSKYLEKPPP